MMMLRIGKHNVRLKELDEAYRIAFHESKALNVEKKSLSPALPGGEMAKGKARESNPPINPCGAGTS